MCLPLEAHPSNQHSSSVALAHAHPAHSEVATNLSIAFQCLAGGKSWPPTSKAVLHRNGLPDRIAGARCLATHPATLAELQLSQSALACCDSSPSSYRDGEQLSQQQAHLPKAQFCHQLIASFGCATERVQNCRTKLASVARSVGVANCRTVASQLAALRHFILLSRTVSICRNPPKPFLACDFIELNHLSRSVATFRLILCHHDAEEIFHRSLK